MARTEAGLCLLFLTVIRFELVRIIRSCLKWRVCDESQESSAGLRSYPGHGFLVVVFGSGKRGESRHWHWSRRRHWRRFRNRRHRHWRRRSVLSSVSVLLALLLSRLPISLPVPVPVSSLCNSATHVLFISASCPTSAAVLPELPTLVGSGTNAGHASASTVFLQLPASVHGANTSRAAAANDAYT